MKYATIISVAGAFALVGCGGGDADGNMTAEEAAEETGDAIAADSRFGQALEAAGMSALLDGPEPYTFLVPADEAFPADMPTDAETLAPILSQHILPGTILRQDMVDALDRADGGSVELPSYGGENITLTREGEGDAITVSVGGASAQLLPDGESRFDHGVVHQIDAVFAAAE